MGRSGVGSCGWPHSSMFHQPTLEARLEERAADLAARLDVRRGAEVTGLDQDEDGLPSPTPLTSPAGPGAG